MKHGIVLTHTRSLDDFEKTVREGKYNSLKVVTDWGLDNTWTCFSRARVLGLTLHTVVRTVEGDPSYQNKSYPHAAEMITEARPWWELRRTIELEAGNEPNIKRLVPIDPHGYNWQLTRAIPLIRAALPGIRIIGTAMQPDNDPELWYEILAPALRQCDGIAFHAYAKRTFDDTGHLARMIKIADRLFPGMPRYLTEFGIHNLLITDEERGREHARLVQHLITESNKPKAKGKWVAAYGYHVCAADTPNPEYRIRGKAHPAYGTAKLPGHDSALS